MQYPMIEGRALISNIEETRKKLVDFGAVFNSNYAFKDIIFIPRKSAYDLSDDFLRARVYVKNSSLTKKVVLIRKQTEFKEIGKIDNIILRKEFNTEEESVHFVLAEFGSEFERGFEYEREGWQYDFENCRVFVEDIKGFRPSIEIEADSEEQIESLFTRIGVVEKIHASMPEIMRRIIKQ